jgi:FlaA1/EpsC-like NDP-sugar epimerase/lipopolysaccharide/colanic/teichoic acid biosynthesis glycosyltransferase
MKRLFDFFSALIGLVVISPLFAIVALAIKGDSRGPVFYRGERVGKDGKPFRIFKFRTMVSNAAEIGGGITHRDDPRVTRLGRVLRRTKIDELPQLINVLLGEMSLVGPRPEVPCYTQLYTQRQKQVLAVHPGITSIASIRYRSEEQLLPQEAWEKVYTQVILPAKLNIELNYLATRSFGQDVLILLSTLFAIAADEVHFDAWVEGVNRLEEFLGRYIRWNLADAVLILMAYALALAARSINTSLDFPRVFLDVIVGLAIYILMNYAFGIYQRFWRYASGQESVLLFGSVATATIILTIIDLLLKERTLPLGAIWLGGFFSFCLLSAARYRRKIARGIHEQLQDILGFASGQGARVLVVGARDAGQLLVWQLQNHLKAYQVVGFVDDDRDKRGMKIHNVPVYGNRHEIPDLVARLHIDQIIIAIPLSRASKPDELLSLCRSSSAQIKILPGLFEWLGKNGKTPNWTDVSEEALLERAPYQVDETACRTLICDRVVMVTGAAGSMGSELSKQIAAQKPRLLVLVDTNESGLYDLNVELHIKHKDLCIEVALCDITNPVRMKAVFARTKPQLVFHAAAYKHVPVLEEHPQEAIRVNVLGTRIVHSLAQTFGAQRFVLISTDKAVNPTSVLGMTKWLAELIVMSSPREGPMLSTTVRFGNVLGSRGSVMPTFEKQIELGGPITITHPEMSRYFLSINEAVSLVIQTATTTLGGDIYILDMGVPLSIVDLARRMIRAHGLRPDQDIPIEFVGMRPGEKLCEELVAQDEEKTPTDHPAIQRIRRTVPLSLAEFDQKINGLAAFSANGATREAIRFELEQCIQALQSSKS